MAVKVVIFFSLLLLIGCNGKYAYQVKEISNEHRNENVLVYEMHQLKVFNKINVDKHHKDKPAYYETNYQWVFW